MTMWSKRSTKDQPKDRSSRTKAEIEAFTEQARWLIEYHDKRGESLTTRATALLGFSGVILALLMRGPLLDSVKYTTCIQIAGIATVLLLLICALFSLLTLAPGSASAPGIDELRAKWQSWLNNERRGKALGDIADSYLMAHEGSDHVPLLMARRRANWRAGFFITAAAAMLAALVGLAVLLFLVYQQVK